MTVEVMVDDLTGEIKPVVKKNVAARVRTVPEHGEAETPKRPKETKSIVEKVKRFVGGYGANLAAQGGSFFAETSHGWVDVTDEVKNRAHAFLGKNAYRDFMPVLSDYLKVPEVFSCVKATIYHERIMGQKGLEWRPFHLSASQIMLTDGIYDVLTDELIPFAGRVIYGPRVSMPWLTENDEPTRCREFEDMIARALPNPEIRRHFQEVMSCVLQPHVVLRGQIILWGPPGSAKTTIATALGCAPAGAMGLSFISEAELVKSKWAAGGLLNKFANISDDSPVVKGWPGWIKSYTSGNLRMEMKYVHPFRAAATAKMISTCNELQDASDASGAMVDRMFPFRFEQRVTGKWDTEKMTVEYWSEPDRREGIVNWLLDGLIRLRTRGDFDIPAEWEEDKQTAVCLADPLEAWLRDNIERGEGEILREEIVSRIPVNIGGGRSMDMKLVDYMKRLFGSEAIRKRVDGERERMFSGVIWKK